MTTTHLLIAFYFTMAMVMPLIIGINGVTVCEKIGARTTVSHAIRSILIGAIAITCTFLAVLCFVCGMGNLKDVASESFDARHSQLIERP